MSDVTQVPPSVHATAAGWSAAAPGSGAEFAAAAFATTAVASAATAVADLGEDRSGPPPSALSSALRHAERSDTEPSARIETSFRSESFIACAFPYYKTCLERYLLGQR